MKKWVCPVCGYVHEGDTPPEFCPQCKVPGSKFTELKENDKLVFADEQDVYKRQVPHQPFQNLNHQSKS